MKEFTPQRIIECQNYVHRASTELLRILAEKRFIRAERKRKGIGKKERDYVRCHNMNCRKLTLKILMHSRITPSHTVYYCDECWERMLKRVREKK